MTRGWGEVAWVCHAEGALAIHFEYDGASMLFFKVFDTEGRHLECFPEGEHQDEARPARGCSSSSDSWESSGSPELYKTPETSDDSYVPRALAALEAGPQRPAAAVTDLDGVGAGLPWPTVDDGVGHGSV